MKLTETNTQAKETLRVVEPWSNHEYYIQAKLVKDYNKTDASESVAWNGTLLLYEAKGNYYLYSHTGNAAHVGGAQLVPDNLKGKIMEMTAEEAEREVFA